MGKLELTPCDFIIEVGAACIILRQITQLLFKTLNISFKLVGIDGRQIASALGENGHDIVRNLGIAAGHGKRVVDSAHGLIGNANVTAVDRADLAGVSRQNAKLAIRGRNRHKRSVALIGAAHGAHDADTHNLLLPHLAGALAHVFNRGSIAESLLGQAIGRWGNFINVEAFGGNTGLPWGMSSPSIASYLTQHEAELEAIGMNIDPNMPVHPTFLYESLWCLLGFVLIAWYTKRRRFDGELTLLYTAWYGAGRAVIEGLRTDSLMIPGTSLRASQVLAFVLVVAAVILWVVKSVQLKKTGKTQLYVDTEEGQLVVSGQFYQKKNKEQPQVEENFPGNGEPADALSETEEIADEPQPQEEAQSGETAAKESQPEEAADTEDKQQ